MPEKEDWKSKAVEIISTVAFIVFAALGIFHSFGWSARVIDLHWCTESLAGAQPYVNKCDPPSKIIWSEQGQHWLCRCPK